MQNRDSKPSIIYVLGVSNLSLFLHFFIGLLELFRHRGIYCFFKLVGCMSLNKMPKF